MKKFDDKLSTFNAIPEWDRKWAYRQKCVCMTAYAARFIQYMDVNNWNKNCKNVKNAI